MNINYRHSLKYIESKVRLRLTLRQLCEKIVNFLNLKIYLIVVLNAVQKTCLIIEKVLLTRDLSGFHSIKLN
jgi:hypothetical protein